MKIRTKMVTGFGLLITFIFVAVMIIISLIVKANIMANLESQLKSSTTAVSQQVRSFLDTTAESYLRATAEEDRDLIDTRDLTAGEMDRYFSSQKIAASGYVFVIDGDGTVISHRDHSLIGRESPLNSKITKDGKDHFVSFNEGSGDKYIFESYCKSRNWYIIAVADEDEMTALADMEALKKEILSIKIGKMGYPSIFTTDNKMLIHPTLATGTDLSKVKDADGQYIFTQMIKGKEGMMYYHWKEKDGSIRRKFLSYTTMKSPNWVILSSGYHEDYFAILYTIDKVLFALAALSIVLILLAVWIMSSFLVRSIVYTTALLKNISEGDGDLTRKLEIASSDETGLMAGYFNNFTGKLSVLINSVKKSSDRSVQVKEDLSVNLEETISSVSQIDSNLQSVNSRIKEMYGKISHSSGALSQIISGIAVLDNQIQEQSGAVEESTASVTEMVASLKNVSQIVAKKRATAEELVRTSKEGGSHIAETRETFRTGISAKIDQISEMTALIENIAAQTNLLSMNAAIEAAHAGEAGKGFAVVADEIRKLATESTENSKKINEAIKTIIQHIEKTGDHVERTSNAFNSIEKEIADMDLALAEIMHASEELSTGGEQVLTAMTLLTGISETVSSHSADIRNNSTFMSVAIDEVNELSGNVTNAVDEAAMGAAEITRNMATSQDLLIHLGNSTVQVNSEVARFKTV